MFDPYRWALAQNLGYRLASECTGFPKIQCNREKYEIVITGKLPLRSDEFDTKTSAECTFVVNDRWAESPPVALCKEPWVTLGNVDWHIFDGGAMCWDYDARWRDSVAAVVRQVTEGQGAEFGKLWMLRSVRNLLNRHLFAYRSGIKEWRKEWDYWGHEPEAAAKEYSEVIQSEHSRLALVSAVEISQ